MDSSSASQASNPSASALVIFSSAWPREPERQSPTWRSAEPGGLYPPGLAIVESTSARDSVDLADPSRNRLAHPHQLPRTPSSSDSTRPIFSLVPRRRSNSRSSRSMREHRAGRSRAGARTRLPVASRRLTQMWMPRSHLGPAGQRVVEPARTRPVYEAHAGKPQVSRDAPVSEEETPRVRDEGKVPAQVPRSVHISSVDRPGGPG